MLKTFFIGILLGLVAAAGALYAVPAVDQVREPSVVVVSPNGGNVEKFHVNIPMDRVMVGAPDQSEPLPPGLDWPTDESFAGLRSEIYKIRNARDAVVGVAARTAAQRDDGDTIDWVLHLPARGSLFVTMEPTPQEGGFRYGEIRDGSREFSPLTGVVSEGWVADTSGEEDAPLGRIELTATYVGQLERLDPEEWVE